MDRERGFKDAMAQEFPGIKIVAEQYSMSDRAKGMAAAENISTAHPALDGLFASSEPSSVGAAQAVKSRGLAGRLNMWDSIRAKGWWRICRPGVIDALVAQDRSGSAMKGAAVTDKLNGKTPPKRIDLSAAVITKADLGKPEIRSCCIRI